MRSEKKLPISIYDLLCIIDLKTNSLSGWQHGISNVTGKLSLLDYPIVCDFIISFDKIKFPSGNVIIAYYWQRPLPHYSN